MKKKPSPVAVVQATPVLFDRKGSIDKVAHWTEKAAKKGAKLVLFPEAFIPCYPRGLSFGAVVGSRDPAGRKVWETYYNHAIKIGDKGHQRLCRIAKKHAVYLCIGIIERAGGTLYCSLLYIGPTGQTLGVHRKLKPTASERIIWGEGAGDDLDVYDTPLGKVGGLICWENMMPLARMSLYQQEVALYLAPTADHRETWQASMRHIACEGRCFVLSANQFVRKTDYPQAYQAEISQMPEIMSRGGSAIYSPLGEVVAGPIWDKEGILFAELPMQEVVQGKLDFDVNGHYNRPDVFKFRYKKGC